MLIKVSPSDPKGQSQLDSGYSQRLLNGQERQLRYGVSSREEKVQALRQRPTGLYRVSTGEHCAGHWGDQTLSMKERLTSRGTPTSVQYRVQDI